MVRGPFNKRLQWTLSWKTNAGHWRGRDTANRRAQLV